MAGDWIKVEKITPGKTEVINIARILNIHRMHALGLCIEFWIWCDSQMDNGHAFGVTYSDLDELLNHKGASAAFEEACWLKSDGDGLHIPNFDVHLGESAKKRALAARRKQKERQSAMDEMSRFPCDKSVTREEKRRIDNTHTAGLPIKEEEVVDNSHPQQRDLKSALNLPPIVTERLKKYLPDLQMKSWAMAHRYREFCPGQKGNSLMADFAAAFADVLLQGGGEAWLDAYFTAAGPEQLRIEFEAGKRLAPSASPWEIGKHFREQNKKPRSNYASSTPAPLPEATDFYAAKQAEFEALKKAEQERGEAAHV